MTLFVKEKTEICQISTHTLTWSVTIWAVGYGLVESISTHTLTWSVTITPFHSDFTTNDFNSHAHVERDSENAGKHKHDEISTHTLTWSVT